MSSAVRTVRVAGEMERTRVETRWVREEGGCEVYHSGGLRRSWETERWAKKEVRPTRL